MKKIMKKIKLSSIILIIFAMQLALASPGPAMALGTPFAVQGQVTLNGAAANGASVVVTDTNNGAFLTDTVGPTGNSATSGYYSVDLGNLSIAATNGDTINITATISGQTGSTSFVYNSAAGFATPTTIALTAPTPTQLAFTSYPGSMAQDNILFSVQPTVEIRDAGGQVVSTATDMIHVDSYTDSACTVLAPLAPNGTLDMSAVSGQAIYTDLSYPLFNPPVQEVIYLGANDVNGLLPVVCGPAITVYEPTLSSVNLSPAAPSVIVGAGQQFTASALDQNGAVYFDPATGLNASITWSSSNTAVATINTSGLATSLAAGTSTITSTAANGVATTSATSLLTVVPPTPVLTSIIVTPATATSSSGSTRQFTASAIDQFGAALATQPAFTWTSSATTTATINSTGLATAIAAGSTTITATSGTVNGTATYNVTPAPVLTSITISPATATIAVGATRQFTASALDQYGAALAVQPTFTWVSASTTVFTVSSTGLAVGISSGGPAVLMATSGMVSGSASVSVATPVLSSIAVTPLTATSTPGGTQQFTASAIDQFGTALATQPSFTWTSSATTTATINSTGLATAIAAGATTITAASGAVSGTATMNVAVPILTTITVTPNAPIVKVASTLQLKAMGLDQGGFIMTPQPAFTWESSNEIVASVSNTGLLTGLALGTSTISAKNGLITGTALVTVSASTSIEILCDDNLDNELKDKGALTPELGEDYASTTALIATHDIKLVLHDAQGDSEVDLPNGVTISRQDGLKINGMNLNAATTSPSLLSGMSSEEIKGALHWGIVNLGLNFSSPITVKIFVGTALNGQTLNIYRSTSGQGGWTSDGIVAPATSLVINGVVTFQATKASYYSASSPLPITPVTSSPGGGLSSTTGGAVIMPSSNEAASTSKNESSPSRAENEQPELRPQILGEKIYSDDSLLRGPNMKIYLIENGEKILIPTLSELMRYKGRPVIDVSASVIDLYPTATAQTTAYPNGTLLRTPDKKIYVLAGGEAQPILNLKQLMKYKGKTIIDVNYMAFAPYRESASFKSYPNGTLLRTPDKKIYVIVKGNLARIKNLTELKKYLGKPIRDVGYAVLSLY